MLDKSLTFYHFIMKMPRERLALMPEPKLPEGYTFAMYEDGNEVDWARLESLVLEFPSQEKALEYFNREYRDPYRNELYKRCVFVKNPEGKVVATTTAWFMDTSLGHRGWLQWISTDPAEQGKGLGKAVIIKAMQLFKDVEPNSDIYLHTQTWSHTAIYLYHKIGFEAFPIDHVKVQWNNERGYEIMHNGTMDALKEMEKVFKPELIQSLRDGMLMPNDRERTDWPPAEDIIQA
jgi:RimJ/RimL family protein N-acetyltransferase